MLYQISPSNASTICEHTLSEQTERNIKASAAYEIIKYAKEKDVDLIIVVVGTKGRSEMRKASLGSVASKVVTYPPCSVLVVR